MSDQQPALHPERIRVALGYLKGDTPSARLLRDEVPELVATCRAALELVRKGQLAVGLTGDVADAGGAALRLLAAFQKIG